MSTTSRTALRSAAPGLILAVLVLAPFFGKAFTVDDTLFMFQARQAVVDPLHPTAFDVVWNEVPQRVSGMSGPVTAWLLVPAVLMNGAEWPAHAVILLTFAAAIFATVQLGLRLGVEPRWAGAAGVLLAATPAALAMAGTVMPDIPAMALAVIGLERLVAWREDRRTAQGVGAAVFLGLAPLTRSHAILMLGVAALLLAGDFLSTEAWRRRGWKVWVPLFAAPVITVAVGLAVRDPDPRAVGIAQAPGLLTELGNLSPNLIAFATHWVLVIPLALGWILARGTDVVRRWWVLVAAAGLLVVLSRITGGEVPLYIVFVGSVGMTVLWDIVADGWARRDATQLALWSALLVPLAPAPYAHLPSKYLLVSAPAAALIVARAMSRRSGWAITVAMAATSAAGIVLGVAILRADASFAGLARRAVAELVAPNVAAGHRVWFTPHWGFQWYAERAGGRIISLQPPYPAPGDLAVTSQNTDQAARVLAMLRQYGRFSHVARVEDREPGGRLMSHRRGAGFFSNEWGYLPWVWSDEPLDVFDLWRVE